MAGEKSGNHPYRKSDILLAWGNRCGVFRTIQFLNLHSLTVLNYHRIADPQEDAFDTFRPNISATPENFARQMDYMRQNFNIISGADLIAWLRGEEELPPHAAMITFDDGYHDNWANAYPILKARDLPAIIFLTTNHIEKNTPFYWDTLAYIFRNTEKDRADLPLIGERKWQTDQDAEKIMLAWAEAAKLLPEIEKEEALLSIQETLDVNIPENAFQGLHLRWDQVREMAKNGIEMGSHTMSHPILTRIPIKQVMAELVESKKRIESEIRMPVSSFAYPNGGIADFSPAISGLVRETGYLLAFSLMPGPTSFAAVKKDPYAIRRIFLSHADTFYRFVGKVTGAMRLLER